ncbi:MAG: hypothetical protein QUS14_12085 [Pyrinomonadaceae bacterium]|nr:hypothetical protein [Pyrinomonadaceae bacterium]
MARFTITQDERLHSMLKATERTARLWETEIVKFRCPRHGCPAHLWITAKDGSGDHLHTDTAAVEACCRDFFEFCLRALNSILDTEPQKQYHIPTVNSQSASGTA